MGLILGPLVGSFLSDPRLVSWFGYTVPFFFSALLAFVAAIWVRKGLSYHERTNPIKTFSLSRPLTLFKEAFENMEIRHLSWTLGLFQLGTALYSQSLLIFLNTKLHYTSVGLALLWLFMGLGFTLGLLILKFLTKTTLQISQMITASLILQAALVILSSFFTEESSLWALSFLFSVCSPFSYALLMAVFSDTAPQESQGWVMGIWSAIIAFSFIIGGLCTNLIPLLHLPPLIFIGGACIALSALFFRKSIKR